MAFDPEAFMSQTVDQPFETERTLVPEGEYRMAVDDFTSDAVQQIDFTYKKGERAGQPGSFTKFNCPIVILDDKVASDLELDKVVVTWQINLDIDDNGQLVWGKNKNITLGQLRAACGQNQAGPWGIPNLRGSKPFMGKVIHRKIKRDDGTSYAVADISRVMPIR